MFWLDSYFGIESLKLLTDQFGNPNHDTPTAFPTLGEKENVICGYNQGFGEHLIVCKKLANMQELHARYLQGWALKINWYIGKDIYWFHRT